MKIIKTLVAVNVSFHAMFNVFTFRTDQRDMRVQSSAHMHNALLVFIPTFSLDTYLRTFYCNILKLYHFKLVLLGQLNIHNIQRCFAYIITPDQFVIEKSCGLQTL